MDDTGVFKILLDSINPSVIFAMGFNITHALLPLASIVLTFAIIFRTIVTMHDGSQAPKEAWGVFFADIIAWGSLLVCYFILINILIEAYNALADWFNMNGKTTDVTTKLSESIATVSTKKSSAKLLFNITTNPVKAMMGGGLMGAAVSTYYLCNLLLITVTALFRLIHAFVFVFTLIWGIFVIPLAVASSSGMVKKWAWTLTFVLVWPLFEALTFFLFKAIFFVVTDKLLAHADGFWTTSTFGVETTLYFAFSILVVLAIACVVAAPFFTRMTLNGSDVLPAIMSFAGTAGAAFGIATIPLRAAIGSAMGIAKGAASGGWAGAAAGGIGGLANGFQKGSFAKAMSSISSSMNSKSPSGGGSQQNAPPKSAPPNSPAPPAGANNSNSASQNNNTESSAKPSPAEEAQNQKKSRERQGAIINNSIQKYKGKS